MSEWISVEEALPEPHATVAMLTEKDMTLSFNNDESLKKFYVERAKAHREADEIIQRTYWEDGKGCCVGCLAETSDEPHQTLAKDTLCPEWLFHLADTIHEGLAEEHSKEWPVQFIEALPVGVDLEPVRWHFCAFLMRENLERVAKLDNIDDKLREQVSAAVRGSLRVLEQAIKSGKWDESAAESATWSAESAARSATWSAAWSAARSAAWSARSAARSAAWSARSAAESAAESAAWSAAESAARPTARSDAYERYRDELLRLLEEAK